MQNHIQNQKLNPEPNPELNSELNPELNSELNSELNPELNPELTPELNPEKKPIQNPVQDPVQAPILNQLFKSVLEQDNTSIVICDLNHIIRYMNPVAIKQYEKRGGEALIGKSLFDCHNNNSRQIIQKVVDWFGEDASHNRIYTFYNEKQNKDVYMIALRNEDGTLIGYYEKHEYRNRETGEAYQFI